MKVNLNPRGALVFHISSCHQRLVASLSRGELSTAPPLLVSTQLEGAGVLPFLSAVLLFLSALPMTEQDLAVPCSDLLASLLPAACPAWMCQGSSSQSCGAGIQRNPGWRVRRQSCLCFPPGSLPRSVQGCC